MKEAAEVFQGKEHLDTATIRAASLAGVADYLVPAILPAVIIDAVCELARIPYTGELFEQTRTQHIAFARQIAMYSFRELLAWSFPRVGAYFKRDHSTAMHACNIVKRRMLEQPILGARIRRMMAQLQAGVQ